MTMSPFLRELRAVVGHRLLVLPSVTGLVSDERRALLLIRHSNDGRWNVPGGCVEPDESPEDAVRREIGEETGLDVVPTRLVGVFGGPRFHLRYANGDEVSYVTAAFECRVVGGTASPDGEEAIELGFFTAAQIGDLDMSPFGRALLDAVRR